MMTPKKYGLELRLGVFSTFPPLGLGWGISVLIVYYPVTISFSPFFFFFTRLLPPSPLSSSPTHLLSLLTREKGNLLSLLQSGRREPPPAPLPSYSSSSWGWTSYVHSVGGQQAVSRMLWQKNRLGILGAPQKSFRHFRLFFVGQTKLLVASRRS